MAETARFELAERRTFGPLARAWFQPLTHVSITVFLLNIEYQRLRISNGGSDRIRTYGTRKRSTVFKTASFNHSDTLPLEKLIRKYKLKYLILQYFIYEKFFLFHPYTALKPQVLQ